MKKYPKYNWEELTKSQKEIFDDIEKQVLWNAKVLEWTDSEWDIEVIAYNTAFCLVTDYKLWK
jgi:hypothetical protein